MESFFNHFNATSDSQNDDNVSLCDAQVDIYGPKYFLITLDDFNNNKPNQDLISLKKVEVFHLNCQIITIHRLWTGDLP